MTATLDDDGVPPAGRPGRTLRGAHGGAVRTVRPGDHVTLNYRVALAGSGAVIADCLHGTAATFQMGTGQLAEPLEHCLIGLEEGAHARFELAPAAAYGEHNPAMRMTVGRRALKGARAVGPSGDDAEACGSGSGNGSASDDGIRPIGLVRDPTAAWTVGMPVEVPAPHGGWIAARVADVGPDHVVLDFNHPLAGQGLVFEVRILGVL